MIVIETDHTRPALGLYGQPTAWVRMWCKCNGCGAAVSEVRENDPTDFGQGMVRADASARGGRRRSEADRVPRLACPACQATRDGGRFGWMDCSCKVVGFAMTYWDRERLRWSTLDHLERRLAELRSADASPELAPLAAELARYLAERWADESVQK